MTDESESTSSQPPAASRPVIKLDPANIPPELHPLIPYAEKWGIEDDALQETLLHEAPLAEIEELYRAFYPFWDKVWDFRLALPSDEPQNHDPATRSRRQRAALSHPTPAELQSHEVRIFTALMNGVGHVAGHILRDAMPKTWLEIIGAPEQFQNPPLDPAKIPAELHPIIPYADKWVLNDDGVRSFVFDLATTKELAELASAVNQVGDEVIRDFASQIGDDEIRWKEAYILLILLDLAQTAEISLRIRGHDQP